ncbi:MULTISPECIES: hypothetical protein [Marinovum]|uniref:hypothetical protein n=1 Tax=Marinovum TaxID=367771 RepID=UPI00237BB513|nr:hypothetical protein [Marinovum sp. PR37]MDD9746349.1 hypothetical protein [Marinovum sp. PR37]
MSFVRPEVRRALWRWREVLAGVGLLALGLWWGFGAVGWMINGLGYVLTAMAGALVVLGLQRGRFRDGADGPGVVQIVEGRVAYFGPLTGGAVDMADLSRLSLDRRMHPAHWILAQPGHDPLHIPVTAKGADQLFDAFTSLPGLRTEYMLRELGSDTSREVVIWQRRQIAPALH